MLELGLINKLRALRQTSVGIFLGNDAGDEVLLPMKYIPAFLQVGGDIDVFIYLDSEDRPIATNLKPLLLRNQFGYLQIKEQTSIGAFLEWGLEKDLLLPYREQAQTIEPGKRILVYLYLDETTYRLVASSRIRKFINRETALLEEGMVADLLVTFRTDLGYTVILNNMYEGMVYHNEIFQTIKTGDRLQGFISKLREDGKIDVRLQASGIEAMEDGSTRMLQILRANGGKVEVGDKSAPATIYNLFNMSKKNFKRAAGILYKQGLVQISDHELALLPEN